MRKYALCFIYITHGIQRPIYNTIMYDTILYHTGAKMSLVKDDWVRTDGCLSKLDVLFPQFSSCLIEPQWNRLYGQLHLTTLCPRSRFGYGVWIVKVVWLISFHVINDKVHIVSRKKKHVEKLWWKLWHKAALSASYFGSF